MKHLTCAGMLWLAACAASSNAIVSRIDYGEAWPFTIESGELACQKDGPREIVTLASGSGVMYALNGSAKSAGFPDAAQILKPGKTGAHTQQFISMGLALCR